MIHDNANNPTLDGLVDAVVIGRNEGTRLVACLASLVGQVRRVVYVDSGSDDGSVAAARSAGAEVVELDMARPFTAARARNAGLAQVAIRDMPEFVQVLDGDCALRAGWVAEGMAALRADAGLALVFGRRRERFPEASVYNALCDKEWDVPIGRARACGGDYLARTAVILAAGGYRDDVIAAEDDELCQRLLAAGWQLARIEPDMTWHDAAMTRLGQWWRRAVRAGHGFAQVGALHPGHFVAERRRVWFWGLTLPLVAAVCALSWVPGVLVVLVLYGLSFLRSLRRLNAAGMAALITASKFPNLQGMLTFHWRQWRGTGPRIIEYK